VVHLLLLPIAILFAFPLIWLTMGVFWPTGQLLSPDLSFPSEWTLGNVETLFSGRVDLARYAWNTAVLCGLRTIAVVFGSSLAAYAFTQLEFPGRRALFVITVSLLVLPEWAVVVPQYQLFGLLGWLGSNKPLTLPLIFGGAYTIFLLSAFMRYIPKEITEAARIDGASHFQVFWRVVLPNMKSALTVAAILSIVGSYNDFFGQLIYLSNESDYTLALATFQFVKGRGIVDVGAVIAFTALSIVPLLVLFLVGQRQLRESTAYAATVG
jgi:multiple sugar transport system permease protein